MRAARILISAELLRDRLDMPSTSNIIGATYDWQSRAVELIVDDPDLPESDEPLRCYPTVSHVRWDWNLKGVEP